MLEQQAIILSVSMTNTYTPLSKNWNGSCNEHSCNNNLRVHHSLSIRQEMWKISTRNENTSHNSLIRYSLTNQIRGHSHEFFWRKLNLMIQLLDIGTVLHESIPIKKWRLYNPFILVKSTLLQWKWNSPKMNTLI